MSSGDRGVCLRVCVACVCTSVFTGMWMLACRYMLICQKCQRGWFVLRFHAALKKMGKLNKVTDVFEKLLLKPSEGLKLNTAVWKHTHTHTLRRKDMTYQAMRDFIFSASLAKSPLMVECKKRRVSKKEIWSLRLFFPAFILPSAHLSVNETPSDLRDRSFVSHLQFFLSFSYSRYRWTSSSSNLISRELKMYLLYLPMWVCAGSESVCVCLSGGCSDGGSPSHVHAFRPKPGRFPPPKINVCESICAPVCVSRFCKTNLSSVHRFSAIEPSFDHSATVNNAREATAHLQHRMLAMVCVWVRARGSVWQDGPFSLLQMQQGSSSTFLHLALLISCQIQELPHWYCLFECVRVRVPVCVSECECVRWRLLQ